MTDPGSLILHDGARPVDFRVGCDIIVKYSRESGSVMLEVGDEISAEFPGFYWRWRMVRVGLFGRKRIRVCDDPEFCPIVAYGYHKPRGLLMLEGILAEVEADGQYLPVVPEHALPILVTPIDGICLCRAPHCPATWRSAPLSPALRHFLLPDIGTFGGAHV